MYYSRLLVRAQNAQTQSEIVLFTRHVRAVRRYVRRHERDESLNSSFLRSGGVNDRGGEESHPGNPSIRSRFRSTSLRVVFALRHKNKKRVACAHP